MRETRTIALTDSEQELMQILWRLGKAFIGDIMAEMPHPAPRQTAVAARLRILESKGAAAHEVFGKSLRYYPLLQRDRHIRGLICGIASQYFDSSFADMVRFVASSGDISADEAAAAAEVLDRAQQLRG